MLNDTHGQCQIHTELFEDVTYYITVRAVTGCHEEYIVSSSDGVTLDRVSPKAIFSVEATNDTIVYIQDNVIYQSVTDSISIVCNVSDSQEIQSLEWGLGSLPSLSDIEPFTQDLKSLTSVALLVPGEAVFVTLNAVDKAGNQELASSYAVIADTTAPEMIDIECTQFISVRKSIVTCSWQTIVENESILKETTISMGSAQNEFDILDRFVVHKDTYSFTRDLYNNIDHLSNITVVFITVTISNVVGHKTTYGREVIVDRTAPDADRLDVVTSATQGRVADHHQKCQLPRGYVEVKLINVADEESSIDDKRYLFDVSMCNFDVNMYVFDGNRYELEDHWYAFDDRINVFYEIRYVYDSKRYLSDDNMHVLYDNMYLFNYNRYLFDDSSYVSDDIRHLFDDSSIAFDANINVSNNNRYVSDDNRYVLTTLGSNNYSPSLFPFR
ncbi:hypothetical protein DPMN_125641 [Dreissena polymorpha]|uniref:Uncharacterized protein n=1 Tax=Dreissena polymorpha TaxID=45954 RepID=A0A9D4JXD9_DREPO|nr:hypothetical protein DPMN_125641 [Dreissena polymorpha]